MRLPEDEPFYMRRNLWGAIERYIRQRPVAELAEASQATLVHQVTAQDPAATYTAAGQISIEGLTHLISEVIAELAKENSKGG